MRTRTSGTCRRWTALRMNSAMLLAIGALIAQSIPSRASAACPCTVFNPSSVPASPAVTDNVPIEAGMKFRSNVDGYVTGVRFYKGALNTGTHMGHLWSSDGVMLAEATFQGETASGWQEVPFTSPVAISANTTYVVSYSSPQYFANTPGGFGAAVVNLPLRGLADGEDGPNGVFHEGATGVFPTSTFSASNYWADVVFNATVGPDLTPPSISSVAPPAGSSTAAFGTTVSVTFDESINPASVTAASFTLRDAGDALVPATVSVLGRIATLTPDAPLVYSSTYTALIAAGVTDLAGNATAGDYSWSFTTLDAPPPPPDEGPGGPILVVSAVGNPFGRYCAEILRTEGLNEFTATDISNVTALLLNGYQVVILGEMALTPAQVTMFGDWVGTGGHLIAMRPDKQLAGLLGLTAGSVSATLSNGYLLVDTSQPPGQGIVGETIQFHGTADLYALNGATSVATLYSSAASATPYPAVTRRAVGTNGGQAAAFTYDLARSVVYTRQGNPAWVGQERDGDGRVRSNDLFVGDHPGVDDWFDLTKVAIPQADEQQRLLANMILEMNRNQMPLPRFWYFPNGWKAIVIMTMDDHGGAWSAGRFEQHISESPSGCSVDDWECVRASAYLSVPNPMTDATAAHYTDLGFEVSIHSDTNCDSPWADYAALAAIYAYQWTAFVDGYPSIPHPSSERGHCVTWADWASRPKVQASYGIRLDDTYYYFGGGAGWNINGHPGMHTGSGIPMRFADLDGTMIDVFQATTYMTDESGQSYPFTVDTLLDRALGSEGYYGSFCANMHADSSGQAGSIYAPIIVASAQARGVPVVSGRQMLTWLDARNGSAFQSMSWTGNTLNFVVARAAAARQLEAMLPTLSGVGRLTELTHGGTPVTYRTETLKGIEYAIFDAASGSYAALYQVDTTPPTISAVVATVPSETSALVTWSTNELSDSRVDYGTQANALDRQVGSGALVLAHSMTLPGLSSGTTYYYRVRSADDVGNASTDPAMVDPPRTFSTPHPDCFLDRTVADFAAGSPGSGIYISESADGEVTLAPTAGAEFSGATLPAGWSAVGGTATVSTGVVTLDGTSLRTDSFYAYPQGDEVRSLEFLATIGDGNPQFVGFGNTYSEYGYAMFASNGGLTAHTTNTSGTDLSTALSSSLLGQPHVYRVEWRGGSVDYFVDGTQVAHHVCAIATNLRPVFMDYSSGGPVVVIDWARMSPFSAAATFESRVYGAGAEATWESARWTSGQPAGTGLQVSVRMGNVPIPDDSWTAYTVLPGSGSTIQGSSQFIQYKVDLSTTDPSQTPVLRDLGISCAVAPDEIPPLITGLTATPSSDGTTAFVNWGTNEPADSRVDFGLEQGSLGSSVSDAGLVTTHSVLLTGLVPGSTYHYRATSADAANNARTEPNPPIGPLSFSTPVPTCFADQAAADFAAGSPASGIYISETADGEVTLAPTAGVEFSGATLPAGWSAVGGTATVGGGVVTMDGTSVRTDSFYAYPQGGEVRSLEFLATIGNGNPQFLGFGNTYSEFGYAIFASNGGFTVHTTNTSGTDLSTPLSSSLLGQPHVYRVEWRAGSVDYYVDGTQVAHHVCAIATNLRPVFQDFSTGGPTVVIDWARMTPYSAAATFESRVYDGGSDRHWVTASWNADTPEGTVLAVLVRQGNTPVPDMSWTAFTPILSSGAAVGGASRYIQYRADLSTGDTRITPALRDIEFSCTADPTPPVISAVAAVPGGNLTTATVTWTTDEPATSRVDYGTAPGALTSNVVDAGSVTSHSLVISGLTPGTTYYYRVTSADAFLNSATSPDPPAAPLSFALCEPESCNGLDDDCNGLVDDGITATIGIPTGLTGIPGQTVVVPVSVSDVTGRGAYAAEVDVTFDSTVISPTSVAQGAALTGRNCTLISNLTIPGHAKAAIFCEQALVGGASLADVSFLVVSSIYGPTTALGLPLAKLNEGCPAVTAAPGSFAVRGPEICDGQDNDGNGPIDDGLGQTTCGLGVCLHTIDNCVGGLTQMCNPMQGEGSESCNGLDDDCDGVVDDGGGALCSDGDVCTSDACTAGQCVHAGSCGVSGTVRYYRDATLGVEPSVKTVPNVGVGGSPTGPAGATTDGGGVYALGGLYGNVTVTTVNKYGTPRASDHNGAITGTDAAQIARSAVGLVTFSANQRIAADVTGNGTISSLDAAQVARFATLLVDHFPVAAATGSDWKFLRCDAYAFPGDPGCSAPAYDFTPLVQTETGKNFYAVLYGDVTGNWAPAALFASTKAQESSLATGDREALATVPPSVVVGRAPAGVEAVRAPSTPPAVISIDGLTTPIRAGERRQLSIRIGNADGILGLDMGLKYDASRVAIVAVQSAGIASGWGVAHSDLGGKHRIAIYGVSPLAGNGAVMTVTVEGLAAAGPAEPIELSAVANEGAIPVRVQQGSRPPRKQR